jgi:hypothetical protein
LTINPNKTVVIPFTRKRNIKGLKSKRIQVFSDVKYLGITIDKGLTWKMQLDKVIKAYKAFWTGRGTFDIWENLGTETKGDILDIHCGGKTYGYLYCHYMVA